MNGLATKWPRMKRIHLIWSTGVISRKEGTCAGLKGGRVWKREEEEEWTFKSGNDGMNINNVEILLKATK